MLGGVLVGSLALGCDDSSQRQSGPKVGSRAIAPAVVDMVAKRDGLEPAEAELYVEQTLRWVADAERQAAQAGAEPTPLLTDARAEHLRRAAAARVWLDDVFEPAHRVEDIQASDPAFVQAANSSRFKHPRVHVVCQLVAAPSGKFEGPDATAELIKAAEDEAWRERAKARFDPVAARLKRYMNPSDPQGCTLVRKLMRFEDVEADGVTLRIESGGFDLDACAQPRDADGTCSKPMWASEWSEEVAKASGPQVLPTFSSRFGFHLVMVVEVREASDPSDPDVADEIRTAIGPQWSFDAFQTTLAQFREKRAVRVATDPSAAAAQGQ